MDTTKRARLRALYEGIALPWSAVDPEDSEGEPRSVVVSEVADVEAVVATVDMGFDEGCNTAHAALIVGAVNALPALLDALDATEARHADRDAAERVHLSAYNGSVARRERAEAERDALRAIVDGRTTTPSDAEIAAHEAAGGRWRCLVPSALHMSADALHAHAARWHRDTVVAAGWSSTWWSLDHNGRPCAWPSPTPAPTE